MQCTLNFSTTRPRLPTIPPIIGSAVTLSSPRPFSRIRTFRAPATAAAVALGLYLATLSRHYTGDSIEYALAIELGADAEDLALTIHPHPTLSETVNFAAEVYEGTATDIYMPKKKKG